MDAENNKIRRRIMSKQYRQLKDIKLQSILELDEGPFRTECLNRLKECGFIKEEKPEWQEITMRDLHKIRAGVTLKRVLEDKRESIVHMASNPYWSSWQLSGYLSHILVCQISNESGYGIYKNGVYEYGINDLFNGRVYILEG